MSFLAQRERAGLTQKETADALGVDQSAVSLWENGKNYPRAAQLVKLASLYGCTVDELLKEEVECTHTTAG